MKLLRFLPSTILLAFGTLYSSAQLTSTNLPIVMITTPTVISTTQIQGTISIVDNSSGLNAVTDPPTYTGMIGVNLRGDTSYLKKSYSIETWSAPNVSFNTSLLSLPIENDWVLLSSYEDRSLLRNVLSLNLHDKMGRYASRQRYCEVMINSQYVGIYTFGEKIKRDSLRLDIANLGPTDNSGINLTGGYIVKIDGNGDGWTSAFTPPFASGTQQIKFEYEYPSANDIIPVQKAYIKSYVDSFEAALNASNFQDTTLGWRRFGAENSFIDFMIIQELSKNNEAYRKNTFLYKDKGTKLRPGPLWNFNLAWKNTVDCNGAVDTGWCYNFGGVCGSNGKLPPFWWNKLNSDISFMEELKCRYSYFRKPGQPLDTVKIFAYIDSVNTYLNASNAISRNFTKWPIWGVQIVNEPTPMATNYNEEITNFKKFIKSRITWLDTKWLSTSANCWPLATTSFDIEQNISIYPNPSTDKFTVQINNINNEIHQIVLHDIQGMKLKSVNTNAVNTDIDISNLPNGIYFVNIKSAKGIWTKKVVKR